jgi:hypothetical protein
MSIVTTPAGMTRRASLPLLRITTVACLLAATVAWHALTPANTDIAWLLTVGEHVLDGARPYADIIETNPPGSVLLYMPAVLLARAFGLVPEVAVVLLTTLCAAASLGLSAALFRGLPDFDRSAPLLRVAAVVLLLLPAGSFGQREHIILMTSLPLLCAIAARAASAAPASLPLRLVAAVAAGVGFAVKPHYALGLVGPLAMLWRTRGWRGLVATPEAWTAAIVALLLVAVQFAAFPDFTHTVLPLLMRIYLPARQTWSYLFTCPSAILEVAGLAAYAGLRRNRGAQPIGDTAVLAALGFFAAYLMQGKGWPYHAYPAIASTLIGLGALTCGARRPSPVPLVAAGAAILSIGFVAGVWFDGRRDLRSEAPGLEQAVTSLAPHPKIMSLASDIAVGHPFVREIGGRWVGTLMSSWISLEIRRLTGRLDPRGPYGADLALQDRVMASDIRERKPDAVLATTPGWSSWLASQPTVADALADYHLAGTFGDVMLWTRNAPESGSRIPSLPVEPAKSSPTR